tara:strand:- start:1034 stop:2590 length:1557 start_codon:yes stop_codon:yes gene_type:complete
MVFSNLRHVSGKMADKIPTSLDILVLFVLALIAQSLSLYMIPLVFECDAAAYFTYDVRRTYRGPVYPLYLALSGQYFIQSFWTIVIGQGLMGIAIPILIYGIIAPSSRLIGLILGLILIFSHLPFTAAKFILATQLFMFLVVATVFAFSRYVRTENPLWMYATVVLGLAVMFTRWEGQFVLWPTFLTMGFLALRHKKNLRQTVISLILIVTVLGTWSFGRAQFIGQENLFGTLQNGTGGQAFWLIYQYYPASTLANEHNIGLRDELPIAPSLVHIKNGPASQQLHREIIALASESDHEGDVYQFANDIFENPSVQHAAYVVHNLRSRLGHAAIDNLLKDVSIEAIKEHPLILFEMFKSALSMTGISARIDMSHSMPLVLTPNAFWGEYHYANVPYNLANCASIALPPSMLAEYKWDSDLTESRPIQEYVAHTSYTRDLLRNSAGILVFFLSWFAIFTKERFFYLSIAVTLAFMIGVMGALGGGAFTRYEYPIIILISLLNAGGILGLLELRTKIKRRL